MVSSMTFIHFFVLLAQGVLALEATPSTSSTYQKECNFTRYPNLCVETLNMGLGSGYYQHVDIVSALVNKTLYETKLPTFDFPLFTSHFGAQKAQLANSVAGDYINQIVIFPYKIFYFFFFFVKFFRVCLFVLC